MKEAFLDTLGRLKESLALNARDWTLPGREEKTEQQKGGHFEGVSLFACRVLRTLWMLNRAGWYAIRGRH